MGRKAKVQVLLAALIAWPVWAQTYNPTLIPPQIIGSPQGMNPLNLGDDNTRAVNLGFTFDYYGKSYTSAWVSSNGFVSFQSPADLCCNGYPMDQSQRNTIYGYWTDLISGGNPYYKSIDNGILFGWYGTKEYGTNNSETFEIALYGNGNIQINYGNVANTYHYVSAGLTGPTTSDNLELFYGRNVQNLSNQSGLITLLKPVEVQSPVVVTPTPVPTVAPNPVAAAPTQTATVQTIQPVETQTTTVDAVAVATITPQLATDPTPTAQVAETTSEVVASTSTTTEQTTQQATTTTTTTTQQDAKEEQKDAPLPPGGIPGVFVATAQPGKSSDAAQQIEIKKEKPKEVANTEMALASEAKRDSVIAVNAQDVETLAKLDAQYTQKYGEQRTSETVDVTYSLDPQSGTTFGQVTSVAGQPNPVPVVSFSTTTDTASGQAQQLILLNLGNMQTEMSAGTPTDIGDVNASDREAMLQLAAAPAGYSSYTQARIPDAPFYRPRDIYQNSRIPDANMALYRLLSGQDARWQQMVDEQYD